MLGKYLPDGFPQLPTQVGDHLTTIGAPFHLLWAGIQLGCLLLQWLWITSLSLDLLFQINLFLSYL